MRYNIIYVVEQLILHVLFIQFFFGMIDAGFNYLCDPVDYSSSPSALRVCTSVHTMVHTVSSIPQLVSACWWFYFSKLVEFMDTLFFILRKKNNQISFLHVYHHASMPIVWWIGVKWAAGGSSECNCVCFYLLGPTIWVPTVCRTPVFSRLCEYVALRALWLFHRWKSWWCRVGRLAHKWTFTKWKPT